MDTPKGVKVILLCLLFVCVKAQNSSVPHDINPLHPSMSVVLIVLSIMFCLTFLIVGYAKFCYRTDFSLPNGAQNHPGGIIRSRSRFSGLDRTLVESLPFFRFSSLKGSKEGLECAVCLTIFEETEILRLLPRCKHAFHMICIDTWLENHSSCPLCRYKLDVGDLKSFAYSNSFRNPRISIDEPNLEYFIQREQNQESSSRFSVSSTIQKLTRSKREEPLIQEFRNERKIMHNFKHKIIASDIIYKSRWSDVNSSDLMSLNSEMLNFMSSKRFSTMDHSNTGSETLKIKEDMERKRLFDSKFRKNENIIIPETSSKIEMDHSTTSKLLDPDKKRSMSEITNVSRFMEVNAISRINVSSTRENVEDDEKIKRVWFPIAKRTLQWFAGRETSLDATNRSMIV